MRLGAISPWKEMIKASWCFWVSSRQLRTKADETCTFNPLGLLDDTNNHVSVNWQVPRDHHPGFPPRTCDSKIHSWTATVSRTVFQFRAF